MIVKIQVPITLGDDSVPQALVYNREHTFEAFLPVDVALLERMRGRPKAFFHIDLNDERLTIGKEADWQGW
jgi:hypothetical protein